MTIRLLIADDAEMIREAVKLLLLATEINVVGEAPNGQVAVSLAERLMPDVVLLDIRMPIVNGIEALRELKSNQPNLAVVMHSTYDSVEQLRKSYELGASGFHPKTFPYSSLATTICSAAHTGNAWTKDQLRQIRHATNAEV